MKLYPVNPYSKFHINTLYALLAEREAHQNISHKEMPSLVKHTAFVQSNPYAAWYLVTPEWADVFVGSVYLSKQNEIGIFIFKAFQGHGYGKAAVEALMAQHKGPFLANVAPGNLASQMFFEKLGFKTIQVTYVSTS